MLLAVFMPERKEMTSLFIVYFVAVTVFIAKCWALKCPSSCYCDESGDYVSCVGDNIWKFPMDIPPTTTRLELRNYLIRDLSVEDLKQLMGLKELKLQQSRIEIVENSTFLMCVNLRKLDLSQNALSSLTSAIFTGLDGLKFLDLSTNLLESVDEAFLELSNLEQLSLRDNKISQLTSQSFVGLQKVQYLNLDANNITAIEVGTFQYLTNLAHLIISNNPLSNLSRLDFFGSRLQYIDISHVGLQRVPQSLTKFVRDLRLAKNNLTQISAGDFDSYPHLGLLVLDDNCVSDIENDALGRLEYLMRLWLNGNCLTKVPANLPPSLLSLYMEENKLTELTSYTFKGLINLEQLFLQRNSIRNLETCAFCDLVSLQSLDLQANLIENLTDGVFANLTRLETLDLSQNILKFLDSRCFEGLTRLTTLQMSRVATDVHLGEALFDPLQSLQILEIYDSCQLVHGIINSTRLMHGLRNVQELNIMHNKIVHLRSDFPSFLPNLKIIKMSGNLWSCDKDIIWLSSWIKQSNLQFSYSYSIRCASPLYLYSKPIMMITEDDVMDGSVTHTIASELSADSFVTSEGHTVKSIESIAPISPMFSDFFEKDNSSSMIEAADGLHGLTDTAETLTSTGVPFQPKSVSNFPFRYNIFYEDTVTPSYSGQFITRGTVKETTRDSKSDNDASTATNFNFSDESKPESSEIAIVSASTTSAESLDISTVSKDDGKAIESTTIQQNTSSERRVISSRLRSWAGSEKTTGLSQQWDQTTTIVVSATLAGSCLLVVLGVLTLFTVFRCKHQYQPVKHRHMRRSSSISYYPQKDEVSIVTLTEGTVGLRTNSHHGLGNKLYYIMENGTNTGDSVKEALPDPQLQELLPQSSPENLPVY